MKLSDSEHQELKGEIEELSAILLAKKGTRLCEKDIYDKTFLNSPWTYYYSGVSYSLYRYIKYRIKDYSQTSLSSHLIKIKARHLYLKICSNDSKFEERVDELNFSSEDEKIKKAIHDNTENYHKELLEHKCYLYILYEDCLNGYSMLILFLEDICEKNEIFKKSYFDLIDQLKSQMLELRSFINFWLSSKSQKRKQNTTVALTEDKLRKFREKYNILVSSGYEVNQIYKSRKQDGFENNIVLNEFSGISQKGFDDILNGEMVSNESYNKAMKRMDLLMAVLKKESSEKDEKVVVNCPIKSLEKQKIIIDGEVKKHNRRADGIEEKCKFEISKKVKDSEGTCVVVTSSFKYLSERIKLLHQGNEEILDKLLAEVRAKLILLKSEDQLAYLQKMNNYAIEPILKSKTPMLEPILKSKASKLKSNLKKLKENEVVVSRLNLKISLDEKSFIEDFHKKINRKKLKYSGERIEFKSISKEDIVMLFLKSVHDRDIEDLNYIENNHDAIMENVFEESQFLDEIIALRKVKRF